MDNEDSNQADSSLCWAHMSARYSSPRCGSNSFTSCYTLLYRSETVYVPFPCVMHLYAPSEHAGPQILSPEIVYKDIKVKKVDERAKIF